jgi:hypothetical protein
MADVPTGESQARIVVHELVVHVLRHPEVLVHAPIMEGEVYRLRAVVELGDGAGADRALVFLPLLQVGFW